MADLKTLFMATRPGFFTASVAPVLVGASEAWRAGGVFRPALFALTVLAVMALHAGMNVLNDYYDYLNGTDNINRSALPPFSGGSGLIQAGRMSPGGTFLLGTALLACGSLIGLYLALVTSPLLFIIGGAGLLTGLLYSAPPVFLAGRGLGELTVGLDFGLLVVLGAFVVQTGALGPAPAIASLPLSFLIAAILYMNEFPDLEADRATGKKTLVVRLGRRRAIRGFYVIIFGAYLSLVIGVVLGFLAAASLLALLSAPLAVRAAMVLRAQQGAGPGLVPGIKSLILAHLSCALLLAGGGVIGA